MTANDTHEQITIIEHEAACHAGWLLETLTGEGSRVDIRRLHAGEALPRVEEFCDLAGLIVLGGSMNADQTGEFPFLEPERRLLAAAVEADLPLLGICLGAQQLAAATGGRVYARTEPEVGWLPIEIVRGDPLLRTLGSPFEAFEWHGQSFDVSSGSEVLALRPPDDGVQAFRVGRRAWGVQFHPEVDESILRAWVRRDTKGLRRRDPDLLARVSEAVPRIAADSKELCRRLVQNFVASL